MGFLLPFKYVEAAEYQSGVTKFEEVNEKGGVIIDRTRTFVTAGRGISSGLIGDMRQVNVEEPNSTVVDRIV